MTITMLPKKLNKEPLLEALLEIRFICNTSVSTILPGLLFSKLEGEKQIEQLSTAQIPIEIRNADPNLQFAPITRLIWNQFYINIGDKNLSISCPKSYPGWEKFKEVILKVMEILDEINIIQSVERYSIKYINLIPFDSIQKQIASVNLGISVAGYEILKENFQFRVEVQKDGLINVINIMTSATTTKEGVNKQGIIVDIDTIAIVNKSLNEVFENLENTRQVNKTMFFDCLTQETIDFLEPVYE